MPLDSPSPASASSLLTRLQRPPPSPSGGVLTYKADLLHGTHASYEADLLHGTRASYEADLSHGMRATRLIFHMACELQG
jgi:hypothetical protein